MCKVFGYARISTAKQSLDRQILNIKSYDPEAEIYEEAYTGTKIDRPEFTKLLKRVKSGDTIVFDEVSRMSRNAEEGFKLYTDLYERGVNLVFLKERTLDTVNFRNVEQINIENADKLTNRIIGSVNDILMAIAENQIESAFAQAEHEVEFLHKRTSDGMKAHHAGQKISEAKTGKQIVIKKKAPALEQIRRLSKDFEGQLTDIELMKLTGLARNTYYKYKKELKD